MPLVKRRRHMPAISRHSLLLGGLLMALAAMAPLRASGVAETGATLQAIDSRVEGRAGIVTIEASDPVPYVASQPDPRSFVVELRDVAAAGFADRFTPDPRNPVS